MLVGNEAGLVEASIQNAFQHGVDAFVIVETASRDGTAEILKKYRDDPRFDIRFLAHKDVYSQKTANLVEIWHGIIERAKTRFKADWILRMDADEFIMVRSGTLKQICARLHKDELALQRFNAIIPQADFDFETATQDRAALSQVLVMARPFPMDKVTYGLAGQIPLILTKVAVRPISRAANLRGYDEGGHAGMGAQQQRLTPQFSSEAWFVHFWFTTEQRFLNKCQFISDITNTVRVTKSGGWQWNLWGSMSNQRGDAARAEFHKQILDKPRLEMLMQQGRITRADRVFEQGADNGTNLVNDHLAELGWTVSTTSHS